MDYAARKEEMLRMRFEEFRSTQRIADHLGISRERVRQVIGNSRPLFQAARLSYVYAHPEMSRNELASHIGVAPDWILEKYRSRPLLPEDAKSGSYWELHFHAVIAVQKILEERGLTVSRMRGGDAFDLLIAGSSYDISIKVLARKEPSFPASQKHKSPKWTFPIRRRHTNAIDFYVLVTGLGDHFVIPNGEIDTKWQKRDVRTVAFCWPCGRPTMSKMAEWHERWELIVEAAK